MQDSMHTKRGVMDADDWIAPQILETETPAVGQAKPRSQLRNKVTPQPQATDYEALQEGMPSIDVRKVWNSTLLERRLLLHARITKEEFHAQHPDGQKAVYRSNTNDLFELGQ